MPSHPHTPATFLNSVLNQHAFCKSSATRSIFSNLIISCAVNRLGYFVNTRLLFFNMAEWLMSFCCSSFLTCSTAPPTNPANMAPVTYNMSIGKWPLRNTFKLVGHIHHNECNVLRLNPEKYVHRACASRLGKMFRIV